MERMRRVTRIVVFALAVLAVLLLATPVDGRRKRSVPTRYAASAKQDKKKSVKKSLIDETKRAAADSVDKQQGQVEAEVAADGNVKQGRAAAAASKSVCGGKCTRTRHCFFNNCFFFFGCGFGETDAEGRAARVCITHSIDSLTYSLTFITSCLHFIFCCHVAIPIPTWIHWQSSNVKHWQIGRGGAPGFTGPGPRSGW